MYEETPDRVNDFDVRIRTVTETPEFAAGFDEFDAARNDDAEWESDDWRQYYAETDLGSFDEPTKGEKGRAA